ncbi:hypothetical protein ACFU7T_14375 [Streptomyces sp. NPDC057555]|uniref:hypothetical protein n=1 Tax=Streptomyces sp. NPDC057555 TaxID=3346166 RepID=UPI003676FCF9
MKLALWRALLAPITSLRALIIQHRSRSPLPYDVAWRQAHMLRSPDEMVYRLHGHQPTLVSDLHNPHRHPTDASTADPT